MPYAMYHVVCRMQPGRAEGLLVEYAAGEALELGVKEGDIMIKLVCHVSRHNSPQRRMPCDMLHAVSHGSSGML
jgi:hypothetical protein